MTNKIEKLVIVEQENGTKISSQQKNFDKFDKIIFREFQPGLLHDKGKTKAKGLPEVRKVIHLHLKNEYVRFNQFNFFLSPRPGRKTIFIPQKMETCNLM